MYHIIKVQWTLAYPNPMGPSSVQIREKFGYVKWVVLDHDKPCYNPQNDSAHSQREVENTLLAVGSELLAVGSELLAVGSELLTVLGGQLQ